MGLLQRSQLAQKVIVAIDELLIPTKTALKILVLADVSTLPR
jgi:hypothetical protein